MLVVFMGIAGGVILSGCEDENKYVKPPPAKVVVAEPVVREIVDYLEFTGTTEASARVEVRARVSGILESMHFVPGTTVNAGDQLFTIDPDRYEADVEAAKADLASAEARQVEADKRMKRASKLIKRGNIAQAKVDEAEADAKAAAAEILVRRAKLRRAQIDLGYTKITAPIGGRVGRNLVDIGNLVGEGKATVLTEVTASNPIFAYFNLNERDLLRVLEIFRKRVKEQNLDVRKDSSAKAKLRVELGLANEIGYPHVGILDFAESRLDPGTGTLKLRGTFENKELPPLLLAGLFVRVRLPIDKRSDMPLVTERAIGFDQGGQFVLVVNGRNVVEKRPVKLGRNLDGLRVIEDGLQPSDRVVVNGLQRARPGAEVTASKVDMSSLKASAIRTAAEKETEKEAQKDAPKDRVSGDNEKKP